jgi:hypothetical protein
MSPTAPTFVTLNDRLNKAHRRIRELEAREIDIRRPNRRGTTMFDLDPIAAIFLIIAIVWLIGTVAYGRDHH